MFVICAKTGNACTNTDCREAGCVQKRRENQDDLLTRLRYADANSQQACMGSRIFREAADEIERQQALCDINYVAGMKFGWNLCVDGDVSRREAIIEARQGPALKRLKELRPIPPNALANRRSDRSVRVEGAMEIDMQTLMEARDACDAAAKKLCEETAKAYPVGTILEVTLGHARIEAEVVGTSDSWWARPDYVFARDLKTGVVRNFCGTSKIHDIRILMRPNAEAHLPPEQP